jgi:thioester reductase-like protein
MSSVSTVANWADHGPRQSVPELALDDPALPTAQGYSESKWVAERLLHEAGKFSGLSSAILRIGQIAGPVEGSKARSGMWNRQEWLPSVGSLSLWLYIEIEQHVNECHRLLPVQGT